MIRPLGSVPSSPWLPPARGAAGQEEAAPSDRVELGRSSAPTSAPQAVAPAGPAAPSAAPAPAEEPLPDETLRLAAREGLLVGLQDLEARFAEGTLQDEDFQRGAWRLSQAALREKDPFVRRKARQVLYAQVQGTTGLADWQLKKGMLDGPVEILAGRTRSMRWSDRNWFVDETFLPALDAIADQTQEGPVPERAVRTVAHLACALARRSEAGLDAKIRENETPEDDLRWAGECAALLDEWWSRGGVRVVRDGLPLWPGSLDLLEEVTRRRVAVSGSVLDLSEAPAVSSPRASALLEGVKWWEKEGCPPADRLEEMAQANPGEAAALMAEIVALAAPDDRDPDKLARLLDEAATRPALAELFRPHLQTLATVASRSDQRGMLAPGNLEGQAKVKLYGSLLERFPELADEEMVRRELSLLLLCEEINTSNDAGKMVGRVWKSHPELVGPTMEVLLAAPAERLESAVSSLALAALKDHGWKPTMEQRDAMLQWLFVPGRSLFESYESVRFGLDVLKVLEERRPGSLEALRLPGPSGWMAPARRALLERLMADPHDDLERQLFTGGHFLAREVYAVVFPDAALESELLDRVERGYAAAGSLKMDEESRKAFAVLGSVDLSEGSRSRLDRILAPEIPKRQGWYLDIDVVERTRQRWLAGEVASLAGLPGEARLARAVDLLELVHGTRSGWEARLASERLLGEIGGLDGAPVEGLLEELSAVREPLEKLSPRAVALLQLLDSRPEAREGLGSWMRPRLGEDPGFESDTVGRILERWRWDQTLQDLSSAAVGPAARAQALRVALEEASDRGQEAPARVYQAFEEGLKARGASWTADLAPLLPDPALRARAFEVLASRGPDESCAESLPRFAEVLSRVGGPSRLEEAASAWASWENHLAEGIESREALRIALLEHALGTGEVVPAGEITGGESQVAIGGVSLPVRGS